jgi:hypothetical protein
MRPWRFIQNRNMAPRILNHRTRRRWMVFFTSWSLHLMAKRTRCLQGRGANLGADFGRVAYRRITPVRSRIPTVQLVASHGDVWTYLALILLFYFAQCFLYLWKKRYKDNHNSSSIYCHKLITMYGVWINNWIKWTLVTSNNKYCIYKSLNNLHILWITKITSHKKSSVCC